MEEGTNRRMNRSTISSSLLFRAIAHAACGLTKFDFPDGEGGAKDSARCVEKGSVELLLGPSSAHLRLSDSAVIT